MAKDLKSRLFYNYMSSSVVPKKYAFAHTDGYYQYTPREEEYVMSSPSSIHNILASGLGRAQGLRIIRNKNLK